MLVKDGRNKHGCRFNISLTFRMVQHTLSKVKKTVKILKLNTMFITAVCIVFLIKLRWPSNKSLYDSVKIVLV